MFGDEDDQVQRSGGNPTTDVQEKSFHVFIFQINHYLLALDADQILNLSIPAIEMEQSPPEVEAGKQKKLIDLCLILGEPIEALKKPRTVTFHGATGQKALEIEEPIKFTRVMFADIVAMPSLIVDVRGSDLLWGIFYTDERPVFLLDLRRIHRNRDRDHSECG